MWEKWCPGAESNHRHADFQSAALPTELPGPFSEGEREAPDRGAALAAARKRVGYSMRFPPVQRSPAQFVALPAGVLKPALPVVFATVQCRRFSRKKGEISGSGGGIRTPDTRIMIWLRRRCLPSPSATGHFAKRLVTIRKALPIRSAPFRARPFNQSRLGLPIETQPATAVSCRSNWTTKPFTFEQKGGCRGCETND